MKAWLRHFFNRPTPRVVLEEHAIELVCEDQYHHVISKSDIQEVLVRTGSFGPFAEDVWFLLVYGSEKTVMEIPQGMKNTNALADYIMSLPGADEAEMIRAMGSTHDALFRIWRRSDG